jgi:hypothetical protein
MATYEIAGPDVETAAQKILARCHSEIIQAGVTFRYLIAWGEEGSPAIKQHGWPCLGLCKIIGLKERVAGLPDVCITLDGLFWGDELPAKKEALLAHELEHVEVVALPVNARAGAKWWREDKCGRPKTRIRPHDFQFGGFDVILDRYKKHSQEYLVAEMLSRKLVQAELFS